jgi:nucleoside-diphosphate-sugar epimerase
MRVLITGSGGRIGRSLYPELQAASPFASPPTTAGPDTS